MNSFLVVLLIFTYWLESALNFKLTNIPGLSLQNLVIYILLFSWMFSIVSNRRLTIETNVNIYIVFLLLIAGISIVAKFFFNEISDLSVPGEMIAYKSWANPYIIFFIVINILTTRKECIAVLNALIVLLLATTLSLLTVVFTGIQIGTAEVILGGRGSGFSEPNQFASYMVLFFPLIASYALYARTITRKVFFTFFFFILLIGLIMTGSRGGIISLAVCFPVYFAILKSKNMISGFFILFPGIAFIFLAIISYALVPSNVKESFSGRFNVNKIEDVNALTSGRNIIWPNSFALFTERPFTGHGHNSFVKIMKKRFHMRVNSHCDFLLIMVQYGLFGLILFITIFFKLFSFFIRKIISVSDKRTNLLYISYIAGLAGYFVSMSGVNIITPRTPLWIYTALMYVLSLTTPKEADAEPDHPITHWPDRLLQNKISKFETV